MAKVEPWTSSGSGATDYYHTDKLGTNRMMTDELGVKTEESVYTAFGERISGTSRRYGYVGAWGYQSHVEMPYQHVGARYYDPSSGRFLQRDPIGIDGGANVYAYVLNRPTAGIDPTGNGIWSYLGVVVSLVGGAIAIKGGGWLVAGIALMAVGLAITIADLCGLMEFAKTATEKFEKVHKKRLEPVRDMIPG